MIYDKRLLTKNYGQRLLNALPVFPIEQPEVPEVKKRPAKPAAGRKKASVLRGAVLLVSKGGLHNAAERAGCHGDGGSVVACGHREIGSMRCGVYHGIETRLRG